MNPKKPDGDRFRDYMVAASFPPSRVPELKAYAKREGHTVSSMIRTMLIQRLDAAKACSSC